MQQYKGLIVADKELFDELEEREQEVVRIHLIAAVQRTAISLNEYIQVRVLQGADVSLIRTELMNDLNNNGRLFGEFRNSVKATAQGSLRRVSDLAYYSEEGIDKKYRWITVQDSKVCPDCSPRHGEVAEWETWEAIGLPRSGWSVCRSHCRCELVNTQASVPVIKRKRR